MASISLGTAQNFFWRRLKNNGLMHATQTWDVVVYLRHWEWSRPFKIFHTDKLYGMFPDFVFDERRFISWYISRCK